MSERVGNPRIWDRINKSSFKEPPFKMEILAEQCVNGDYILVLGSEIMLDRKSELASNYGGNSELLLLDGVNDGNCKNKSLQICQCIQDLEDNGFLKSQFLNPFLKDLLCQRCFRTIVTTAFDPYLEVFLDELWHNYYVLNINADGKDGIKKDISNTEIKPNEFNKTPPILYYAFGKAEYKNLASNGAINEFAVSDNDKMKIVAQWLGSQGPRNFLKHMEHKRILAIGCKYDDWLFRFFWYMLQKDINLLNKGEVAFDYIEDNDYRLKDYLDSENIKMFDHAQDFMAELTAEIKVTKNRLIEKLKKGQKDRISNFSDKGLFISYAHEDFWVVKPLYEKLSTLGFNVWMDVRLEAADKYDPRIESAINECRVFIPILSSAVRHSLESGECENRYFYNVEWKTAENRINILRELGGEKMDVLPIIVDSFDMSNNYQNKLRPFIKSIHSFDIGRQKTDYLIEKIVEIINNDSNE